MTIKNIKEIIDKNRKILEEKYKIKSIGIFGSMARGENETSSDVDILIEFTESPDIFKFIELEQFLGQLIGVKVDLVTRNALKTQIKDKILREAVYI